MTSGPFGVSWKNIGNPYYKPPPVWQSEKIQGILTTSGPLVGSRTKNQRIFRQAAPSDIFGQKIENPYEKRANRCYSDKRIKNTYDKPPLRLQLEKYRESLRYATSSVVVGQNFENLMISDPLFGSWKTIEYPYDKRPLLWQLEKYRDPYDKRLPRQQSDKNLLNPYDKRPPRWQLEKYREPLL